MAKSLGLGCALCCLLLGFAVPPASCVYNFALFWPYPGAAEQARQQFDNLHRPILDGICASAGVSLPADFSVAFEEFYVPAIPTYSMMNEYASRLANSSFLHAGSTQINPFLWPLIESAAGFAWQLHSVEPPPLSALAPSLLKVVRKMQLSGVDPARLNDSRAESEIRRSLDQIVVVVVGPPYSFAEVRSILGSFDAGVICFAIDPTNWDGLFDKIYSTKVTTILVLANREDTSRMIDQGLDGSLWSADYRWILYNSALIYSVKGNLLPANARNITSLEFGSYTPQEAAYLTDTRQVMLYDLLYLWTAYLANLTCGFRLDGLSLTGLSGTFNLTASGAVSRHDWRMSIYGNVLIDATLIGDLSTLGHFNMSIPKPRSNAWGDILSEYRKLNLTIFVIPGSQYVRFKAGMENRTDLPLKDRMEGMAFDLCMEVLNNLGLTNVTVKIQKDLTYGSSINGEWNGIVASLIEGVANFACVDLTPTAARREVIDFSVSYFTTNMSILYKMEATDATKDMFQFMFPFSLNTWLYLGGAMLVVSLVLAILHRISANKQFFDLQYSVFFSFASLVQGIAGNPPDRPSARLTVMAYWLFVLIMLVAYVSNYAAMRTLAILEVDITTVSSLLDQTTYEYGTLANSSLASMFQDSTFADMRQVYSRMRRFKNGQFTDPAVAQAAVRTGKFALIYDTPTNEYQQQLICDTVVTGHFENTETAFGLPQRSDLKPLVNDELKKLLQKGRVTELYRKYFILPDNQLPNCDVHPLTKVIPVEPDSLMPQSGALTLHNTLGLLIINVLGCCLTLLVAGLEHAILVCRAARTKRREVDQMPLSHRRRSTIATILRGNKYR